MLAAPHLYIKGVHLPITSLFRTRVIMAILLNSLFPLPTLSPTHRLPIVSLQASTPCRHLFVVQTQVLLNPTMRPVRVAMGGWHLLLQFHPILWRSGPILLFWHRPQSHRWM